MKVVLKLVTIADLIGQASEILDFAAASDVVLALYYDNEMAGLIGFVPSQGAYLWMYKTPLALAHRVTFARYAKRIIAHYKTRYHTIRGHSDTRSRRWLKFLGAEVKPLDGDIVEFTIHG
jgi:hypothetical protein